MQITLTNPSTIVRAVVPLDAPRDVSGPCQLALQDPADPTKVLMTQWHGVSRNASNELLCESVELIALNPRGLPGVFNVVESAFNSNGSRPNLSGLFARHWLEVPPSFNNGAERTTWRQSTYRHGPVCATREFYGRNFVGWLTVYYGTNLVEFEMLFHQAVLRSPDLFFPSLTLDGAGAGWATMYPEPDFAVAPQNGLVLVPPRADGKLHGLVQRGARPFRIVLHDGTAAVEAQAFADEHHIGFASTWHDESGCYGPEQSCIPKMTTQRQLDCEAGVSARAAIIFNALLNGLATGISAVEGAPGAKLDWFHPWGGQDGGGVSGGWRYTADRYGLMTIVAKSTKGLRELVARADMITRRMPILMLDDKCAIVKYEDYLTAQGTPIGQWSMSAADGYFDHNSSGIPYDSPFGFAAARALNPTPANVCSEWAQQIKWAPINWQHCDRAVSSLVALVNLRNDPMAKFLLRSYAECFRMSMKSQNRLKGELAAARTFKGHGTTFGRAHGEGFQLMVAAYRYSSADWRGRWRTTIHDAADVLRVSQMPNGLFRAHPAESKDKWAYDPDPAQNVAITKGTEEAKLADFLNCYAFSVCTDGTMFNEIVLQLRDWLVKGVWAFLWQSGGTGQVPVDYAVVRMAPRNAAPFTAPGLTEGFDKSEIGAGMHFAGLLDPEVEPILAAYTGNASDPLTGLYSKKPDVEPSIDDWWQLAWLLEQS